MNTRFLFFISLVITVFAVWFYRNQGELDSIINISKSDIEYEATEILAVQTDTDGVAEYLLKADKLTHYAEKNIDKLESMTLNWQPNQNQSIVINADEANMLHEESKVIMSNNVIFSSQPNIDASDENEMNRPPLKLVTKELTGDLNQKKIYSNSPIDVTQGNNSFHSQSFNADVSTGEYEFSKVAVTFMPPERKDVPLF